MLCTLWVPSTTTWSLNCTISTAMMIMMTTMMIIMMMPAIICLMNVTSNTSKSMRPALCILHLSCVQVHVPCTVPLTPAMCPSPCALHYASYTWHVSSPCSLHCASYTCCDQQCCSSLMTNCTQLSQPPTPTACHVQLHHNSHDQVQQCTSLSYLSQLQCSIEHVFHLLWQ